MAARREALSVDADVKQALLTLLDAAFASSDDPAALANDVREVLSTRYSPRNDQPIDLVRWVPIDKVQANDYNPNSVAPQEMRLLHTSISHDGYTQPVVTIYDPDLEKYVIVDGFHRYTTMRLNKDIYDLNGGLLPIVVIDKTPNERRAATIRHNRARGKHSVKGMSNIVFEMLRNGATDPEICDHLGLEAEELLRLKHITGFAKLFAKAEYGYAWETERQIALKRTYEETHPDEHAQP